MKWFIKVLIQNYANFNGRARRQEYWMFILFQVIIFVLLGFISAAIEEIFYASSVFGTLFLVYLLATLIPWLGVNVRRLHDTGKSGGYLFINLIPIVGRIWYIVLVASNGDIGSNKYGPDPKKIYEDEIEDIGKPLQD